MESEGLQRDSALRPAALSDWRTVSTVDPGAGKGTRVTAAIAERRGWLRISNA